MIKTAYLHETAINSSEGRLRLTIGPDRASTMIAAELYWRDSASSRESALALLLWHCERHGYIFIEILWHLDEVGSSHRGRLPDAVDYAIMPL